MSAAGITPHRPQATDFDRDDRATVAVFVTVLSAVIAIVFYARSGFVNPVWQTATMLGVALFISVSPFVAWRVSVRGHYDEPQLWWRSHSTLTIAAVAITGLTGMLGTRTALNPLAGLAALGFLSATAAIVLWIRQGKLLANLVFLAGTAAFALWTCGVVWIRYKDEVSLGATDTPFNGPGLAMLVVPLFFTAILLFAVEVKKDRGGREWAEPTERPLRTDYAAGFFLVAISIGLIPSSSLDAMGIGHRTATFANSAVSLFLLVMGTSMAWWRTKRTSPSRGDFVFLLVFAPIMLVSIGFMSPYLMLVLAITGIGITLLGRLFRDRLMAACALICLAAIAGAWNRANHQLIGSASSVDVAWWPYFVLVNLVWSWLYIYLRVREERLETVGAIRGAALEGRITDVVVVAIVIVVSVVAWLTAEVSGIGGAFAATVSDLARWLTLSLLMGSAWRWLTQLRKQREDSAPGSIRTSQLWLAGIAIPMGVTILLNVLRATLSLRP